MKLIYIPALVKIKLLDELTVNGYILSSLQVLPEKKAYHSYFMLSSTFQKKSNIVMPMHESVLWYFLNLTFWLNLHPKKSLHTSNQQTTIYNLLNKRANQEMGTIMDLYMFEMTF